MIAPKKLNQRLALQILLPLAVLMITTGLVGFFHARNALLTQWSEASMLKLQRAAHQVDMRLERPKALLEMLHESFDKPDADARRETILGMLENMEDVVSVRPGRGRSPADRENGPCGGACERMTSPGRGGAGASLEKRRSIDVTRPYYDASCSAEAISLNCHIGSEGSRIGDRIEVVLNFRSLMENISAEGWWQSHKALLVDDDGQILVGANFGDEKRLGDSGDPLEIAALEEIGRKSSGTIRGPGHPPEEVVGFYRLAEAPWTLVLFAPGKEILSPIIRFRTWYLGAMFLLIFVVIAMLQLATRSTVASIKDLSAASKQVAEGVYGPPLATRTKDEIGELTQSFNTMVLQLEERSRLKKDIDLAMEVQQSLLPKTDPEIEGLDIAGATIYCDETGGDYYDFLEKGESGVGVAVGDVSGHGISAALLMASTRAFLRQRNALPGSLGDIISDVNRRIAEDCEETGSFVTLFYLDLDLRERRLRWARAGHDPGILYDPSRDEFEELNGVGVALGIDENWRFEEYEKNDLADGGVIVLGTDGIWETANSKGEAFGKAPLFEITRQHHAAPARDILESIIRALTDFRDAPIQDDATLVVIKIGHRCGVKSG